MLKDSQTSRYATRRTHRTYTREFKAELVAACRVPGASIAAVAGANAMNANVLHRWLKEHARSGCHGPADSGNANLSSVVRIPLIVTDDSGIVTGHSGDRDRCR